MLGPGLFGWRRELQAPLAAAGAGVAAYSLMTRYHDEGARPLSMQEHLAIDALQGVSFCVAAALLDREPKPVRLALAGYGLFSLAAAGLTDGAASEGGQVGQQVPLSRDDVVRSVRGTRARQVAPGVAYRRLGIVNVVFLGPAGAGDRGWVLVDAGLAGTAELIEAAAAERFGPGSRPAAIVMTHVGQDADQRQIGVADRDLRHPDPAPARAAASWARWLCAAPIRYGENGAPSC